MKRIAATAALTGIAFAVPVTEAHAHVRGLGDSLPLAGLLNGALGNTLGQTRGALSPLFGTLNGTAVDPIGGAMPLTNATAQGAAAGFTKGLSTLPVPKK
ncbi:hypothetical protein ABZ543_13245 [Streptomyces roseifaciens]